ncbi:MAG TPA: hypothetical protein VKY73_13750 [Polyangiaceae bacterium]|nr:hypothetical protein [Polyangiaceae bacterium]
MRISAGLPERVTPAASPLRRVISGALLASVVLLACSSEGPGRRETPNDPNPQGQGGSTPPPPPGAGGMTGAPPVMIETGGGGGKPPVQACASETTPAVPAPLDIYLMLDISRSMLDASGGGEQKWAAVKSAITSFLTDPSSSGISVGIQYFPLRKPGVPAQCTTSGECGDAGPCFLKWCTTFRLDVPGGFAICDTDEDCRAIPASVDYGPCSQNTCAADVARSCTTDEDCYESVARDFGPCEPFGQCENDRSLLCPYIGEPCGMAPDGTDRGMCVEPGPSVCFHGTECGSAAYGTPAVPIGPLPDTAETLLASIEAQVPDGDTPSGPALAGAIAHAREFANQNPGHTVVTVLATDGLPTECLADDATFSGTVPTADLVWETAGIAAEGFEGTPSIPTFVIGVFSSTDTSAPENLALIAEAGGSGEPRIVDAGGDVTQQFLEALNAIRRSRLACEYQIPMPESGESLNYFAVNVEVVDGDAVTPLYYVGSPDRCDVQGGWYYDDHTGTAPTKILVCPSNCDAFQSTTAGSVQIKLGCETIVL